MRPIRFVALSAAALSLLTLISTPAVAGQPNAIRNTPANELRGAGTDGYVAWQQNPADGGRSNVFVKPDGEAKFRVNPERAQGYMGGFDGTTLAYQHRLRGQSNIKLFDVVTRDRSNPPSGINTERWEYWPTLSDDHYLFGRLAPSGVDQVILFDERMGSQTVLAETNRDCCAMYPGQVNGDYAVWAKWTPSQCNVFVHQVSTEATTRLPNPNAQCQYGPSVASDGTVYYGRSGPECGQNAKLIRRDPEGTTEVLVAFGQGRDFLGSYVHEDGASNHVFYDPGPCVGDQNIFKIIDPTA